MDSKRILLVDDELIVKELTETMLAALDHKVTSFEDADEALAHFVANPGAFDLIITDQSMPVMTGVELARKIKASNGTIPVVISTGHSAQQITDQLEGISECFVLEKPFNLNQLSEIVQTCGS